MQKEQQRRGKFDIFRGPDESDLSSMLFPIQTESEIIKCIESLEQKIISKIQKTCNLERIEYILSEMLDKKFSQIRIAMIQMMEKIDYISFSHHDLQSSAIHQQKQNSMMQIPLDNQQQNQIKREQQNDKRFQLQYEDDQLKYQRMMQEDQQISVLAINQHVFYRANQLFMDTSKVFKCFKEKLEQMNLKFTKCQMIYDFQEMKEVNFHEKIDNKNNILFLAELENKEIIGAFTHLCFNPQPNYIPKENPKAFICNINKNVFVYAYKVNRTHSYDKNFLIFGNWEIKVKACDDILQTNWGGNGDCYLRSQYGKDEKSNVKLQWFFGNGATKKQLKIMQYQIFVFQ